MEYTSLCSTSCFLFKASQYAEDHIKRNKVKSCKGFIMTKISITSILKLKKDVSCGGYHPGEYKRNLEAAEKHNQLVAAVSLMAVKKDNSIKEFFFVDKNVSMHMKKGRWTPVGEVTAVINGYIIGRVVFGEDESISFFDKGAQTEKRKALIINCAKTFLGWEEPKAFIPKQKTCCDSHTVRTGYHTAVCTVCGKGFGG